MMFNVSNINIVDFNNRACGAVVINASLNSNNSIVLDFFSIWFNYQISGSKLCCPIFVFYCAGYVQLSVSLSDYKNMKLVSLLDKKKSKLSTNASVNVYRFRLLLSPTYVKVLFLYVNAVIIRREVLWSAESPRSTSNAVHK